MEFRNLDYKREADEVVSLIRNNLQPKFTKETLVWKHLDNPFGRSTSRIAVEDGRIVGVVFSMRYELWNKDGKKIKGVRTFDGCTDKDQRGKGIFKKLMQQCRDSYGDDYDFLMANPNEASFPEHIKLGYVAPKKLHFYKYGLINPFSRKRTSVLRETVTDAPEEEILCQQDYYLTGNSRRFINWRYMDPAYSIKRFIDENNNFNYLIYRKESLRGIKTLILCDFYGDSRCISEVLRRTCESEVIYFVYFLENSINDNINFLFTRKHRPAYVVFKLNNFELPENLVVSLGDMEGRL